MSAGGASPLVQVAILTPRPRWADLCEEKEDENKNAESSSGKSENTVDYIEAERASELRVSISKTQKRTIEPPCRSSCGCMGACEDAWKLQEWTQSTRKVKPVE